MKKEERVKTFLRSAAVADADHDFSGGRSGESTFREIFKTHKDIGTPNPLPPNQQQNEKPVSEYQILDMFLGHIDEEKGEAESFRDKFLTANKATETQIMTFKRWDEDPIPYIVTVLNLGSKNSEKNNTWDVSSEKLYKFMNPQNQENAAFAVDATNVPFYECLQREPSGSDKQSYVANYIISREAMNDAAGKIAIGEKQNNGKQVQINVKKDTATYNILYPAIQMNNINGLSELECFFSNYNLTLGPVEEKKRIPALTLSITDNQLTHQVQIVRHNKENAHPNSVPFLSKFIDSIKNFLFGSGNKKEKTMYNFTLQQKRSGDWLQALALLNPERYGLPSKDRITLITLDKICVAYALFAGIDVIFTYFDNSTKKYWFIRFHKNYENKPMNIYQVLKNDISSFLTNADESGKPKIIENDVDTYKSCKEAYNEAWNKTNNDLINKFTISLGVLNALIDTTGFRITQLEKPLKQLLYDVTTLAVFRSLAVKLQEGSDDIDQFKTEITDENFESIKTNFRIYKHNFLALKTAIMAKKSSANNPEAISNYFKSIFIKNGAGTVAQKTRNDLIDNLVLFKSFFNKANGGANGIGIFTFLDQYLTVDEKTKLADIIEKPINQNKIEDIRLQKYYKQFSATVSYLIITNPNPTILEPIKEVPPSKLLESIEAVIKEPKKVKVVQSTQEKDENLIKMQEAAETLVTLEEQEQSMEQTDKDVQVSDNFQVTDFAAALTLLSFKIQNCTEQVNYIKEKSTSMMGGSSQKLSPKELNIELIHNPLATFYFLLREISFRLSEADDDRINFLIILSQIIIQFFKNKPTKINIFKEYMYYINLENYILERPLSFMTDDIANSVKQGYYGIDTLPSLGDDSFTIDFSKYKFYKRNYNEQINKNLEFMKRLVEYAKNFEYKFANGRTLLNLKGQTTQKKRSASQKKNSGSQKKNSTKKRKRSESQETKTESIKTPTKADLEKQKIESQESQESQGKSIYAKTSKHKKSSESHRNTLKKKSGSILKKSGSILKKSMEKAF
jgi:hypothetical protein